MDIELKKCIKEGNINLLKFFINNGAKFRNENEKYLHYAIEVNNFEAVKVMVKAGSNIHVNNFSLINYAVSLKRKKILRYLKEKGGNMNEGLIMAIMEWDEEMVNFMLELGADKSYQNWFPVMLCFFKGNLRMIKMMGEIDEEVKHRGIEHAFYHGKDEILEYYLMVEKVDLDLIGNLKEKIIEWGLRKNLFMYC